MTDDLVKRLRITAGAGSLYPPYPQVINEAANRIEGLQNQLEEAQKSVAVLDKQIEYLEAEIENLEYEIFEMESHG